jgi:hypothetical protein
VSKQALSSEQKRRRADLKRKRNEDAGKIPRVRRVKASSLTAVPHAENEAGQPLIPMGLNPATGEYEAIARNTFTDVEMDVKEEENEEENDKEAEDAAIMHDLFGTESAEEDARVSRSPPVAPALPAPELDGTIYYVPDILPPDLLEEFRAEVVGYSFEAYKMNQFKNMLTSRPKVEFALSPDVGVYRWGQDPGFYNKALPMSPAMRKVLALIQERFKGVDVLVEMQNHSIAISYKDPLQNTCPPHKDKQEGCGSPGPQDMLRDTWFYVLSFGTERVFQLGKERAKERGTWKLTSPDWERRLRDNSLLAVSAAANKEFYHALPADPEASCEEPRFSVIFRAIKRRSDQKLPAVPQNEVPDPRQVASLAYDVYRKHFAQPLMRLRAGAAAKILRALLRHKAEKDAVRGMKHPQFYALKYMSGTRAGQRRIVKMLGWSISLPHLCLVEELPRVGHQIYRRYQLQHIRHPVAVRAPQHFIDSFTRKYAANKIQRLCTTHFDASAFREQVRHTRRMYKAALVSALQALEDDAPRTQEAAQTLRNALRG